MCAGAHGRARLKKIFLMSSQTSPQLSKSRFIAGLQCLKRLYLECYQRELADPIDPSQQALFDTGIAVGELARQRFPNGRLVEEEHFNHAHAVKSTRTILADTSVRALYEAAFTLERIRTRVDVLRRNGQESFDLVEVKSGTSVKPEHIPDVAIQLHVLEGLGIRIKRAYLMHVNTNYVYQGGPYDLDYLFSLQDITDDAQAFLSEVTPTKLVQMWEVLQRDQEPAIETGPHCTTPYRCPFYGYCHREETAHPISELPRSRSKVLDELKKSGIRDIREIPSDFPGLTAVQQRVRDCVATERPFVSPKLAYRLREIIFPVSFVDFETFSPALPTYVGTRPYQVIPFQWSLHVRDSSGQLRHESFLNEDTKDPRRAFVTSLLDTVPLKGTIVVYSGYEQAIMKRLAVALPEFEERLLALCDRTFDLLKLVRESYYHPEFHGSYSIKSVLPALVPAMSYDDLEIKNGSIAANGFARMISPDTPYSEKAKTKEALRAYCQRDTEAMAQVFDILWSKRV